MFLHVETITPRSATSNKGSNRGKRAYRYMNFLSPKPFLHPLHRFLVPPNPVLLVIPPPRLPPIPLSSSLSHSLKFPPPQPPYRLSLIDVLVEGLKRWFAAAPAANPLQNPGFQLSDREGEVWGLAE